MSKHVVEVRVTQRDCCDMLTFIGDKSVTVPKFGIFELLVQKETFADALLTGTVS